MKYNTKEIMKRAWEIKKEADRKTRNDISVKTGLLRELKPEEKAVFGECLKLAWEEVKRAEELAKELNISVDNALRLVKKEHELLTTDWTVSSVADITWTMWSNYGKKRAYFRVTGWSNCANNKKYNYVELA